MKRADAHEVIVSKHGVVVIGTGRVWFRPTLKQRLSERLTEFVLPFAEPRGSPAALLPSGKLLVVGRNGEALTLEVERSPQPGPPLANVVLEGLSPDGVAFAIGPRFFRYVEGAWREEGARDDAGAKLSISAQIKQSIHGLRRVSAVDEGLAVGADGEAWLAPSSKPVKTKTTADLHCVAGAWVGGDGVVLERKARGFKAHQVAGKVSSICSWKKGALMVIEGALFDLKGTPVKAPPQLTSIAAHGDSVWCVSKGALFESRDARSWRRKPLPK